MGLFYTNQNKEGLVGFADAGYLSDPHNARSQTGYVFTHGGVIRVVLFFLHHGFVPLGFPDKVLMRQH